MELRSVIAILVLSMVDCRTGHLGQSAAKRVAMVPILEPAHALTQPPLMEAKTVLVLAQLKRQALAEMLLVWS